MTPVPDIVYLAGPMTGYPDDNSLAFNLAAQMIAEQYGCEVINPVDLNKSVLRWGDRSRQAYYMEEDLTKIIEEAMGIVLLPGWEKSHGACLELRVALYTELEVFEYVGAGCVQPLKIREEFRNGQWQFVRDDVEPVPDVEPESILQEAQRIIHGPRNEAYGHPLDDMGRTGRMWAAILGLPEVTAEQVALCMVAVKISRQRNKPGRDNLVDGCGYFGTIEMMQEERERREKAAA